MSTNPQFGAIYLNASASAAAAAATATLAGSAGYVTYITGFQVTGTGATTQATINVQVLGIAGTAAAAAGTALYKFQVATGGTAACQPLIVSFPVPIPAQAPGSAITVDYQSFGSGNLHSAVAVQGFRQ